MKKVRIRPAVLQGEVHIPPSKSICHRAIISACLARGLSQISNVILSEDITSTVEGMRSLGVSVRVVDYDGEKYTAGLMIEGQAKLKVTNPFINCGESGSTLRFLIPLAGLTGEEITFTGRGKLAERPLGPYFEIFKEQGIYHKTSGGSLPLTVNGQIRPGVFKLRGDISSQFISGLMFLLPLLEGDSEIIVTTEMESKGYVDLTVDVLDKFGITIRNHEYKKFLIEGKQCYENRDFQIEGDYSQAAFWMAAGILGSGIACHGLNSFSLQGDKAVIAIIQDMGGDIRIKPESVEVRNSRLKGTVIDASQCPDLVPVLAVLGALSRGTTRIVNAGRLRLKESDRLKAISTELNKLGAQVRETGDGLLITGVEELSGGTVDSWNDHRIAMALAVASQRCTGPLTITGSDAVNKSYPHFWNDFEKLGGKINERSLG